MADKTKITPALPRVFVYGSLKRGQPNHPALEAGTYLGPARLFGTYAMIDLGRYPGVVYSLSSGVPKRSIYGEVYRITDDILHTLDLIEGHPFYYRRVKVETPYKKAWCYLLPSEYMEGRQVLEEGIWRPTTEEREWMEKTCGQSSV